MRAHLFNSRKTSILTLLTTLALLIPAQLPYVSAQSQWIQLAPEGGPPTMGRGHSTVYDPNSNRMIIFGGVLANVPPVNPPEVWALSGANGIGTSGWTKLSPAGTAPGPCGADGSHSAVYDSTTNRMIAYVPNCISDLLPDDVFVLTNANGLESGTPTWTKLSPTGTSPPHRRFQWMQMTYDSVTNRLILFGGCICASPADAPLYNDLHVLTNANGLGGTPEWIQVIPNGALGSPPARPGGVVVYHQATNRLILFGGGRTDTGQFHDVWVLTNANGIGGTPVWTPLSPAGVPPSVRGGPGGVYDPVTNRLTIFGGLTGASTYLNDVWVLTDANGMAGTPEWTQLSPSGGPPSGRSTTVVNDLATNRMMLYSGQRQESFSGIPEARDVWVLINANGVGDSDQDGVPDDKDQCPSVPGRVEYNGCPVADKQTLFEHTIDRQSGGSFKTAVADASVKVFDRNTLNGIILTTGEVLAKNPDKSLYPKIFDEPNTQSAVVGRCTTGQDGSCLAGEATVGDYLVIVRKDVQTPSGIKKVTIGLPKSPEDFVDTNSDGQGDLATKEFQYIKVINRDGSVTFMSAQKAVITGSVLEIIYPQFVAWDGSQFLYPFIFTSDSAWTVDICASVPVGYVIVSDPCIKISVSSETKVIFFDVVQIGSPDPLLSVRLTADHEGWRTALELTVPGSTTHKANIDGIPAHIITLLLLASLALSTAAPRRRLARGLKTLRGHPSLQVH